MQEKQNQHPGNSQSESYADSSKHKTLRAGLPVEEKRNLVKQKWMGHGLADPLSFIISWKGISSLLGNGIRVPTICMTSAVLLLKVFKKMFCY